jgi:aminocarboxymuconate-semialdehyde decarboxylase
MLKDDGTPFRDVADDLWCLDRRRRDMARAGVHVHVLSTVPVMFSYWAKPDDALDFAMLLNDNVAAAVAGSPDAFVGLGTLPLQDAALAVDELKRCAGAGLAGVQIGSHVNNLTLDAPELRPVWRAAEDAGMAVFVHPWDMIGGSLMGKYFLPWLVGMPAETSLAVCSLLFGGVLERHPSLRVCFAHGAGAFPGTIGRVQHGFDVRPDLCAVDCTRGPAEQCGSFWADTLVHDPHTLAEAARVLGPHRMCLGTDYPFPLGEFTPESRGTEYAAGRLVDGMAAEPFAWTAERRADVLGRNALEGWLARDYSAFARMRRPWLVDGGGR